MTRKNALIAGVVLLGTLINSCSSEQKIYYYEGYVMGTTYHIKVVASTPPNPTAIDSVLFYVDTLLTAYDTSSELMRVNLSSAGTLKVSPDFAYVFNAAKNVWHESKGAFDPTVGPLAWQHGFGPKVKLDTIITGFENFYLIQTDSGFFVIKTHDNVYLDFGGIAKGYGVDKVAWYLLSKGYKNFMIEVGGEVRINGKKPDGTMWKIGIENPYKPESFLKIIADTALAIATSGTYRQKKQEGNRKITHIVAKDDTFELSPDVILAMVTDTSCTYADAWATALIAMGCKRAIDFVRNNTRKEIIVLCDTTSNYYIENKP